MHMLSVIPKGHSMKKKWKTTQDLGITKIFHPKESFPGIESTVYLIEKKLLEIPILSNLYLNIPIPKVIVFPSPAPESVRKTIDLSELFHCQSTYTAKKLFIRKTTKESRKQHSKNKIKTVCHMKSTFRSSTCFEKYTSISI